MVTTAGKIVKNAAKVEKAAKAGMQAGKKVTKEAAKNAEKELVERAAQEAAKKEAAKKAAESGSAKRGKDGIKVTANKKYHRNKNERRKALKRDAEDPNSRLKKEQREYIKEHDGKKVPKDCEVSHDKPLELGKTPDEKRALDKAENMSTMQKEDHRALHKTCGATYHMVRELKGN